MFGIEGPPGAPRPVYCALRSTPAKPTTSVVIVSRNRRVNRIPRIKESTGRNKAFGNPAGAARQGVYVRFIATLKLFFKFDRS
jgi:hypothetical protein